MTKRIFASVFALALLTASGCGGDKTELGVNPTGSGLSRANALLDCEPEGPPDFEPANVLVFGENLPSRNNLECQLLRFGHTVTNQQTLPPELNIFQTIYHVGTNQPLSAQIQGRLIDYVNAGGGLHLTGELSPQGDPLNDSLTPIVRALVTNGGNITIGRQGEIVGFVGGIPILYDVNENAKGDIATDPDAAFKIHLGKAGGIDGVTGANVLAVGHRKGTTQIVPVGAIWLSEDLVSNDGSLTVIMDSAWFQFLNPTNPSDNDNAVILEALQDDLFGEINLPPVADAGDDFVVDCANPGETEKFQLDGRGSTDPNSGDQDLLEFTWFRDGVEVATGVRPTLELEPGIYTFTLIVSDGRLESDPDSVRVEVFNCLCKPGGNIFTRCNADCQCDHGEGDCDVDTDCLPGLRCLHDAGLQFGYDDKEIDVCSTDCPVLGVGAWNYCTVDCPCAAGQGDCDIDLDCEDGLLCAHDVGPTYGFDGEVDVCEP